MPGTATDSSTGGPVLADKRRFRAFNVKPLWQT